MTSYSILFVCTDNLSRSPTAEEVLRQKALQQGLASRVVVSSAATDDLNTGEPIDYHTQKHALRRGYDLSGLRVRLMRPEDFERFDLILAMQQSYLQTLRTRCPIPCQDKLHAFTDYCSGKANTDVPDPFYGQANDLEQMLDIIEDGCDGVLLHVMNQLDKA